MRLLDESTRASVPSIMAFTVRIAGSPRPPLSTKPSSRTRQIGLAPAKTPVDPLLVHCLRQHQREFGDVVVALKGQQRPRRFEPPGREPSPGGQPARPVFR